MATARTSPLVHHLRRLAAVDFADAVSDAELLQQFARSRDEAAFELLLRRHGPMVFGVCRRLLGDRDNAEDCFQAVFLVLARQAGSLRRPEALGALAVWGGPADGPQGQDQGGPAAPVRASAPPCLR